jgi:hypothetical protein
MAAWRSEKIMGTPVMILGTSGTGKSASMRNLNPARVGLINVAKKPLPFRGALKSLDTDDYPTIMATIARAKADIIVIDDAQYLMANAFMRRAKEPGYQKFSDIGLDFWNLVQQVINLPPEKVVYFLGHTEVDTFGNCKFKTIGKMLDDKITVEGMFAIVLRTRVADGHFYFSTVNDGTDTVKTPMGMFPEAYIDNDLAIVDAAIRDYYNLTKKETKLENSLV